MRADVLILTPKPYYSALSHHLQSFRQTQTRDGDGAMRIDLQAIKEDVSAGTSGDDEEGAVRGKTADLLRQFRDWLTVRFYPREFLITTMFG